MEAEAKSKGEVEQKTQPVEKKVKITFEEYEKISRMIVLQLKNFER